MLSDENEKTLLEKARAEETWLGGLRIYEQIIKLYINKKYVEKTRDLYIEIGIYQFFRIYNVDTAEEYVELLLLYSKLFKDGSNFFKHTKNKLEKIECDAFSNLLSAILEDSTSEAEKMLNIALEMYENLLELYSKENNRKTLVRIFHSIGIILMMLTVFCKDVRGFEIYFNKFSNLTDNTWSLLPDLDVIRGLGVIIFLELYYIMLQRFFRDYKTKQRREYYRDFLTKAENGLKLVKERNDPLNLIFLNLTSGMMNCEYGIYYIKDDLKQRKYIDKGIEYLEMGLSHAKKLNNKAGILSHIFTINHYAIRSGRFMYLQKRIIRDLKELEEIGEIFEKTLQLSFFGNLFYINFLPAFYYSHIAQMSFFTPSQRKSFAEKGIDYALKSLKKFPTVEPVNGLAFLTLTVSTSVLVRLSESTEEQMKYAKKMEFYANEVNNIGKKYKAGETQTMAFSALYRTYKTLAEVAENEEEQINMLLNAINIQEKYMDYATESRTGIIKAQMRLGLLYEEVGILTKESDTLLRAKELFLDAIKGSLERGYLSYAATTYEYNARLDDRLGNHIASGENYHKAQEIHYESLKNIKYKPLKKRIQEKINYAAAWGLIETAKANHKSEKHLKAKKNYEEASDILINLKRYHYEALYYSAWALLEEAEQLSKQEMQKEAINQYTITIKSFEEAKQILIKSSLKIRDQQVRERIENLEKVAKIRIKYCYARINLEEGRILGKKGDHYEAAEKFALAASIFREVCTRYKLDRERKELEAIYFLCRAWESMEFAEKYEEPERFEEAANLFSKASNLFNDTKLKLLASGNSAFCQALEYGSKFDETIENKIKTDLYPKVKRMLSRAATSYAKGGFENGAEWAQATSMYFDGAWHLIKADVETDLKEKRNLLGIGSSYLRSAMELFGKAGYKDKKKEVQDRLNRVEKEESILFSALSTIKEPSISRSTLGIVAPSCPIESSQSPRLGEARQFTEEETKIALERRETNKYRLVYKNLVKEYNKIQKRECRVGIAQIGISGTGNIISERYQMDPSGLLTIKDSKIEETISSIQRMVEKAHDEGINILLFPEMTIDLNNGKLLELIADLARMYEMYIVPGSYHDQETKRNISTVFGPNGILWEQEKHIPAVIGIGSGKKFTERIEVSNFPRKTIICNTEYGRIAIVICRDFLDMDLRVELKNFEPPIDIILNPAFTPVTADFKAAHFDARRSIYAYSFFANIGEYGESLIYTPEKDRTERIIPKKEEGLIFKDIDLFKLRSERKKWERKENKERFFIQSTR